MKILINRREVDGPWGGGNLFVKAFVQEMTKLGHHVIHKFEKDIDLIFVQDPRPDELGISINEIISYKKNHRPQTKIVQRINECDARKGTNDVDFLLRECSKYIDHTIFVSKWMKDYHISRGWHCNSNSILVNGVDDSFISREKINNGKLNIVTHHWSNNYMKGFDIYDLIDEEVGKRDDITFSYIGRERGTFKNTNVISPLYGESLAKELGKYDLYISASKFDPGPNHVLEAIACHIPTYVHKDGGGAVEFADSKHVYDKWQEVLNLINKRQIIPNEYKTKSWSHCILELSTILNEITLLKR